MRFGRLAILSAAAVLAFAPVGYAKHGHGQSKDHGSGQDCGNGGDHGDDGDQGHGGSGGEHGHGGKHGGGASTCDAARCELAASLDTSCPCADFTSHGEYVRCVAHAVKALTADGSLSRRCKGKLVRCAARSVCGKGDSIPCLVPTDVCNLTTGTCTADPTVPCAVDLDCGGSCEVADSAEACTAAAGAPAGAISCCAPCGSPSGAFLDAPYVP
jgi:hypothetical protein